MECEHTAASILQVFMIRMDGMKVKWTSLSLETYYYIE